MKSIYLKETILVKDNGEQCLVIDVANDQIFQFNGDVAKLIVILSLKHTKKENAISPSVLELKLAQASKTFLKNKNQSKGMQETLTCLKMNGLLNEK